MSARATPAPRREPKPMVAFFVSLGVSALLLGMVLVTDGRVMELRKAKAKPEVKAKPEETATPV